MSNMKYDAVVSIYEKTQNDSNGKPQRNQGIVPFIELAGIPIRSFSVVGGASRSINLDSADEISIGNEFEQARTYKNITLFVPPTKDFTAVKLYSLRSAGLASMKYFELVFQIKIYSGGKRIQTLILRTSHAWLFENPIPVGNKEALLMLNIRFNHVDVVHGKLNKTSGEIVYEEI